MARRLLPCNTGADGTDSDCLLNGEMLVDILKLLLDTGRCYWENWAHHL